MLRHSFVTRLIKSGVNPKTAQLLARHSDPRLTLGVYSHIEVIDLSASINQIPSLLETKQEIIERNSQTGTGGIKSVGTSVGSCAALSGNDSHCVSVTNNENKRTKSNRIRTLDTEQHSKSQYVSREIKMSPRGVEPLLPP